MNHIDVKYVGIISSQLDQFTKKTKTLYNFRCPFCGDSEKNRYKARGYFYPSKDRDSFIFKCHNCGITKSFANFLKEMDHMSYGNYLLDKFGSNNVKNEQQVYQKPKKRKNIMDVTYLEKIGAERIDRIPKNHLVYNFIHQRRIPQSCLDRLYFVHDDKILERLDPIYKGRIVGNQARVLLPFINRDGELVGVAARAINSSVSLRYLAFKIDKNAPMIFGLDRIKRNSRESVYVLEGPIDSLFLENSIAVGGADFKKLETEIRKEKCIVVFDNEPRNKEIVKRMKDIIELGYKICIWPEGLKEKDINDMVLANIPAGEIQDIINKNTHSGLAAMATLNSWKRVSL